MKNCIKCNEALEDGALFCSACGSKQPVKPVEKEEVAVVRKKAAQAETAVKKPAKKIQQYACMNCYHRIGLYPMRCNIGNAKNSDVFFWCQQWRERAVSEANHCLSCIYNDGTQCVNDYGGNRWKDRCKYSKPKNVIEPEETPVVKKKPAPAKTAAKKLVPVKKEEPKKAGPSYNEKKTAIYELTPQDNCGDCGCKNCMQFAMQAASDKNPMDISDCPHIDEDDAEELLRSFEEDYDDEDERPMARQRKGITGDSELDSILGAFMSAPLIGAEKAKKLIPSKYLKKGK